MDVVVKEEVATEEEFVNNVNNMIEPKKEIIDDSLDLCQPKIELIDEKDIKIEDEYQDVIPYEYRDYDPQQLEDGPSTRKISSTCQKCGKVIALYGYSHAEEHAFCHTDIKRYKCPIDECNFENTHNSTIYRHLRIVHKSVNSRIKRRKLSSDESCRLRNMTDECFPGMTKDSVHRLLKHKRANNQYVNYEIACQICHQKIVGHDSNIKQLKLAHSTSHVPLKLFKCDKKDCNFSTNFFNSFVNHITKIDHGVIYNSEQLNHQLKKQQLEYQNWIDKCFPSNHMSTYELPIKVTTKEVEKPKIARYNCHICNKTISEKYSTMKENRRKHALTHTAIMLYKCTEPNCHFKTKYMASVTSHRILKHERIFMLSTSEAKIELTDEQKKEIENTFIRCFPDLFDV